MMMTQGREHRVMSMDVIYFYNLPLPCRLAAPIQILRTAHAMAELGVQVTVCTGPIERDDHAAALAYYGLKPHPNLELRSFYPLSENGDDLRARLRSVLADFRGRSQRLVVMSRGEPGIELYHALRRTEHRDLPFVLETHRLCFQHVSEQVRTAQHSHLLRDRLRLWRLRSRERRTVESAHGLVCLTPAVESALSEHFDLSDIPTVILPSGVNCDPPESTDISDDSTKDIDILYVGKFDDRKGVGELVKVAAMLTECRFWLIGGTVEQQAQLRERAAREGVSPDRIKLPGYVEPARVRELYRRARVGVCPLPAGLSSVAERFTSPMKVLEMMASGVPVVATDLPSTRAMLTHDVNALLVPANDPSALADGLRRVLTNRTLAQRLAAQALWDVQAYAWPRRAQRLLDFLATIV